MRSNEVASQSFKAIAQTQAIISSSITLALFTDR
jgi:hypothetical protein